MEEEQFDREEEIPSDDYLQQYAVYAIWTIRELGSKFWEWCGHTKDRLEDFLQLKQTDELKENWIDVQSDMSTKLTETPQQHLFEQMESYGAAESDPEDDDDDDDSKEAILKDNGDDDDEVARQMRARIQELESKIREYEEHQKEPVVAQREENDDRDEDDEMTEKLEALEKEREEFDERLKEMSLEKEALERELENERQEKARLAEEAAAAAAALSHEEKENENGVHQKNEELRSALRASREETNRLLALLNSMNGVGLSSKFKTEREVHEMMISIVPNEYTSAIELLESSYQMDPDEDTRPYDVCLKIFQNVFNHTKYRQHHFFEILERNSVYKMDINLAQKLFWGLIQDNFEMLGITPPIDVVDGILTRSDEELWQSLANESHETREKYEHFLPIFECDALEEILNHSIMREYMAKCAEISFFVLWSKMPRLELCGWETRPDVDAVFNSKIHERIWGDEKGDTQIRAVVFPALCRVTDGECVGITKRFVFCAGDA